MERRLSHYSVSHHNMYLFTICTIFLNGTFWVEDKTQYIMLRNYWSVRRPIFLACLGQILGTVSYILLGVKSTGSPNPTQKETFSTWITRADLGLLQSFMLSLNHRGRLGTQIRVQLFRAWILSFLQKDKLRMMKRDLSAIRKLSENKYTKLNSKIIIKNFSVFW